jgi:predicted RNA-binding protein with PUA-like domain
MPRKSPHRYWLLKTEPESFSIQDLARSKRQTTFWNGVRNYQARNFLRDEMHAGDRVLLYHSGGDPSAVVGTAHVVKPGYPDTTALDPQSEYYDPNSSAENPIWYMVDIQLDEVFDRPLVLAELRRVPALQQMELLRKGSRLSVQPVRAAEFEAILKLAQGGASSAKPNRGAATKRSAGSKRRPEKVD